MACAGVTGVLVLGVFAGDAGLQRIDLVGGSSIVGTVLGKPEGRVVVDLGFSVVEIPGDRVVAMSAVEGATTDELAAADDIFFTQEQSPSRPVDELADRVGEGVVLIRTPTGLGSGFFIHPDGLLVTNDHVIAGEHEISVTVFRPTDRGLERRTFQKVRLLATSPDFDLALLQIEDAEGERFRALPIGDSDRLQAGERVFAIGSPLGLERTVSEGILSLANRLINGRLYLQGTAQISPGNSGGPLFNLRGEVIGVNNMKIVGMGAEGLGFAIPANWLKIFLRHRDAFSFDPRNPNSGFRYFSPPTPSPQEVTDE